ncbi:MAG: filamentous hemagglutinin N-terminal domain-containing protein, partial [Azoarcus sp.]|nr:filamentous hemagglutinin N-terminal domain-containing protein [Azoarcus sp.]
MNKTLYRIIFNRHRGQLMVVSESARRESKSAGAGSLPAGRPRSMSGSLSLALLLAFGGTTLPCAAQAQGIRADAAAPAGQQPGIGQTRNGTPQVNIQRPSQAGVSMNQYSQFDIEQRGAILNNAAKDAQTKLAGWVQANPNLAQGEARIIVNQINSRDPSQIKGYIEVAGRRAEVVIANPSGITVDGGGFIN